MCLSRQEPPIRFGLARRISGGGAPMPLNLWALSLWPLGETRGDLPSGRLQDEWRSIGDGDLGVPDHVLITIKLL